ncbi:MAG: ATPase [Oscillospiraceae bacterium]|nr:ATPase [Oscillospiraceae bacterium]
MKEEISLEELRALPGESYTVIDIRDSYAFELGHIDGAVNIPSEQLDESDLPKDSMLVICCRSGVISADAAERLRERGMNAVNLEGGYVRWLGEKIRKESSAAKAADIERSIRKKFHRTIFSKFTKAITEYELVKPGDKIAVCISGGKDSMLMAKLFQELERHRKFPFSLVFLVMDPGYSSENRAIIEGNAQLMNIPVTFFETDIFNSVYNVKNNPCYLCARMRRGHLYSKAKELGCNKIALGHHFDDVIETILMGMMYGGQVETMMPKLHSAHFEGMQIIRPMYYIRESEIKHWAAYNGLSFIQCACRFTDTCTTCNPNGETRSKRQEIKQLIAQIAKDNPQIEMNIFRSVENVNLNKIVSYKSNGVVHSFLEGYDD